MNQRRLLMRFVLPLMLLFSFQLMLAQDRVITGKVTDSKDGSPIVGASVIPKGTTRGTSTGADGSYRITVGANVNTLVITSVGFGKLEVDIAGKTAVDAALAPTGSNLNEIVVVGYGSARKKDLTGSVASIKAKDFNGGIVNAPDQLIQGKVAGVQIINNTGAPGGATTVRIRGVSSLRGGNSPLFVVDGVPLSGSTGAPGFGTALGGAPGNNPLNFINPNDIASMDVLKDASATAIYGSRGANGVVIITTKRGQSGAPRIEFNTSVGVSSILKKLEVMNAAEYKAALTSYGLTSGNYGSDVDAMDAILRTGISSNYNLAITGGNENGRYRISGGYQDQQGIVKQSGFKKYTGSIVGSYKFFESKRFSVDYSLTTTHTTTLGAPISNNAGFQGSLVGTALQWNPTHPLRKTDGSIYVTPQFGNSSINPLALLEAFDSRGNLTTILGSISPSFKITNDLEYKMLYSVNYSTGNQKYELKNWINIQGVEGNGQAGIQNQVSIDQQFTHTLNYNKNFGNLNLSAVAGYEYLKFNSNGAGTFGNKFVDYPGLHYYDYMQNIPSANLSTYSFRSPIAELQSYFGRVNLNYKDKFLLTGTFRVDGSTRFGANNKYGYFPSVGAAWNINNEDFMKDSKVFDVLKLRVGWGQTGNQEFTRNDAALRVVSIGNGSNLINDNYANPDLKWETNTTSNIGLDFGFMNSRFTGSIDVYNRVTTDPIFQLDVTQPGPSGARYFTNLPGKVTNTGVEITLNGAIVKNKDFVWNLGTNVAFQKNKLTDLVGAYSTGALNGQGSSGATVQRLVSGQPLNVYYLRRFEGLDKTSGQSIYTDDGNTLYYSGSPNPTMLLGITTDVSYKNFGFVLNMNGAFGHYLFNETNMNVVPIGNLGTRNIAKSLVGGAVKEAISNPIAPSTRFLEKGNYLKAANATVTYRIGNIGKVIKGATLSLTGQNLFVITKYSGFDPEVNVDKNVGGIPSAGIEYIPYPSARNILLGVRFEF